MAPPGVSRIGDDVLSQGGVTDVIVLEGINDLGQAPYASPAELIGGLKRCREAGGTLGLVAPREPVRKVLSITGLDRVFPIHDSVEQATAS